MDTLKQIDPTDAICFSGHRPDRMPGYGNPSDPKMQRLTVLLRECIENAIERGKTTFINGLMAGWDVLAAEQVILLREKYPHICLATIAPYSAQFFSREKCWTPEWVERAKEVYRQQNIGVTLTKHYRSGVYYERNRALVDHSSELLCYWDGRKGGTKHTVDYAQSKGLTIYNVYSIASDSDEPALPALQ